MGLMTMILAASSFAFAIDADASVRVRGYYRKDGTYVQPHYRSNPDGNPYNNWSYPGNTNPYTGETAKGNPATNLQNSRTYSSSPILTPVLKPSIPSLAPAVPARVSVSPVATPRQYIPPSNPTGITTNEQEDGSLLVNFIGASDADGVVIKFNVALSSSDPKYKDLSEFRWIETSAGIASYSIPAYLRSQNWWILVRTLDNDSIITRTAVYFPFNPSSNTSPVAQQPTTYAVPRTRRYVTPQVPIQNIRAASNLDAEVLERAKPGWLYDIVAEYPKWYEVSWFSNRDGKVHRGWMMRQYAKVVSY